MQDFTPYFYILFFFSLLVALVASLINDPFDFLVETLSFICEILLRCLPILFEQPVEPQSVYGTNYL
jgi:hypothetical protein